MRNPSLMTLPVDPNELLAQRAIEESLQHQPVPCETTPNTLNADVAQLVLDRRSVRADGAVDFATIPVAFQAPCVLLLRYIQPQRELPRGRSRVEESVLPLLIGASSVQLLPASARSTFP